MLLCVFFFFNAIFHHLLSQVEMELVTHMTRQQERSKQHA